MFVRFSSCFSNFEITWNYSTTSSQLHRIIRSSSNPKLEICNLNGRLIQLTTNDYNWVCVVHFNRCSGRFWSGCENGECPFPREETISLQSSSVPLEAWCTVHSDKVSFFCFEFFSEKGIKKLLKMPRPNQALQDKRLARFLERQASSVGWVLDSLNHFF